MNDITIVITGGTGGVGLTCSAKIPHTETLHTLAAVQLVGMLETAKMAVLAGRWGVIDEMAKLEQKFPRLETSKQPKPRKRTAVGKKDEP